MASMWKFKTPGIPDDNFERADDIPITKEEVRSIQISKARLCPGYTVYDIGGGSGSISIESALQVGKNGNVYAVDFNPKAIELTKRNISKFDLSNIFLVSGNAKEKINELPESDAIFIGGTGGDTAEIIQKCENKLKGGGRIVIGVILIETLFSVLKVFEKSSFNSIEVTNITISKGRQTSTGTMMLARNPVTVISATKS